MMMMMMMMMILFHLAKRNVDFNSKNIYMQSPFLLSVLKIVWFCGRLTLAPDGVLYKVDGRRSTA